MSINCQNCGELLPEGTKFCTNCGASIQFRSNNAIETDDDLLIEKSLNQPNKGTRIVKVLIAMVVLTALFLLGKSFLTNTESSEKPFSITEQLLKLEGEWHDPTGVILGNQSNVVVLNNTGEQVVGNDTQGLFEVNIIPVATNNYQATVKLKGVKGDFDVHFYKDENKLVFFNTLTKSSWYLLKIKN